MSVFLVVAGVWCLPAVLITAWILADRYLDQRAGDELDLPVDDVWGDYYNSTDEPMYWSVMSPYDWADTDAEREYVSRAFEDASDTEYPA